MLGSQWNNNNIKILIKYYWLFPILMHTRQIIIIMTVWSWVKSLDYEMKWNVMKLLNMREYSYFALMTWRLLLLLLLLFFALEISFLFTSTFGNHIISFQNSGMNCKTQRKCLGSKSWIYISFAMVPNVCFLSKFRIKARHESYSK